MTIILNDSTDAIKQRLLNARDRQVVPNGNNSNVVQRENVPEPNNKEIENKGTFEPVSEPESINEDEENVCSDGNDDGSIGFIDAATNVVKGVGNGLTNTVKGCFLDEQGNFSPLRTLATAGTIAACVMFPPLGFAACGAGLLIGVNQIGSGVMNAYEAKTDGQAKKAFQDVGEGAFTGIASLAGGRGAFSAIKNTSTAFNSGSALKNLANASVKDKALAFVADSASSMKNNILKVKDLKNDIKNRENLIKKYGYDSTFSGLKTVAASQVALK